ncbi:MAG: GTPase HflX, partial [Microcoleaceae cyanobacterium]
MRVGVGTPRQTQIPPLELPRYGAGRLSGIRCICTSLKPEPPNESALTAMVIQRLDALITLILTGEGFQKRGGGVTGYIQSTYLAHLIPTSENSSDAIPTDIWSISPPTNLDHLADQDFSELVEGLEAEFQREFTALKVDSDQEQVLIVGLKTDRMTNQEFADSLTELARLVDTAGGRVLQTMQQKRSQPHPQTVVGEGKVQEIALAAQTIGANLVVFNLSLS